MPALMGIPCACCDGSGGTPCTEDSFWAFWETVTALNVTCTYKGDYVLATRGYEEFDCSGIMRDSFGLADNVFSATLDYFAFGSTPTQRVYRFVTSTSGSNCCNFFQINHSDFQQTRVGVYITYPTATAYNSGVGFICLKSNNQCLVDGSLIERWRLGATSISASLGCGDSASEVEGTTIGNDTFGKIVIDSVTTS